MTKQEAIRYAKGMLKDGGNQRKQDFVSIAIECIERQMEIEQGKLCPVCEDCPHNCPMDQIDIPIEYYENGGV